MRKGSCNERIENAEKLFSDIFISKNFMIFADTNLNFYICCIYGLQVLKATDCFFHVVETSHFVIFTQTPDTITNQRWNSD